MQPDDDLQTTISKWPFILGDALLVGTALAIAILGDWQLSNWQVASCVLSVALGAALYVLPYIVEYQVRVREEAEDRSAELRIVRRQLANAESEVAAIDQRLEALVLQFQKFVETVDALGSPPDLSGSFKALEAKLGPLIEAGTAQGAELDRLRGELSALTGALHAKPDEARIEELAAELKKLKEAVSALPVESAGSKAVPEGSPVHNAPEDEPRDAAVGPDHKASVARPVRAPRKRRTVEPRMLQRAIEQKQDSASAAVSRIIDGRAKAAAEEAVDNVEADSPQETEGAAVDEHSQTEVDPVNQVADSIVSANEPVDPGKEDLPQKIEEAAVDVEPAPEPAPTVTADLFADLELPDPVKIRRTKKRDTAVIASVFIGIGNKPYLRGSGGGLNWETGVAMEFEEIGKWRWIAPDDLEAPIQLQVYRNDEDPDKKGKHTLEPGQQLEISPEF